MNNADKPAYPTDLETEWEKDEDSPFPHGVNKPLTGLTKRERFAMAAMQGLLSNPEEINMTEFDIATLSVDIAELMLTQLGGE